MILDKIVKAKQIRLNAIDNEYRSNIQNMLDDVVADKSRSGKFKQAMTESELSIIGEIKKASPSKGIMKEHYDVESIAKQYSTCVSAISVLTEEDFFLGSIEHLKIARKNTQLPILRKDFIIDRFQIDEAKVNGADCILLICAILDKERLRFLYEYAKYLGLDVLVEVHSRKELKMATAINADIIGINNRDLSSFITDVQTTVEFANVIPDDVVLISESGFHTKEDVLQIRDIGVNGILVGESFMKANNLKNHAEVLKNGFY